MASYNSLAVYGHRGWFSSAIVSALAASGAPVKVLHRPESDISSLPAGVKAIAVDVNDENAVVDALQGVDIFISITGAFNSDISLTLIPAISKAGVKLFVPPNFGMVYKEDARNIPVIYEKFRVQEAARAAGLPMTVVHIGTVAELAFTTPALGIDTSGNSITYFGNSDKERLSLCTRPYVAAAYASLFARTPISELSNRTLGIAELRPTGEDIASVLTAKHGTPPKITRQTIEHLDGIIQSGSPVILIAHVRKLWGVGRMPGLVAEEVWDVPGYKKETLESLVLRGTVGQYRATPENIMQALREM